MVKEDEYLLTNQEILGGLKSALARGQNLKQAMMSFYQAGYKKEEIEDAARAYLYLQKGISEAEVLQEGKETKIKEESEKEKEKKNKIEEAKKKKEEDERIKKEGENKKRLEKFIPKITETKVPVISGEKKVKEENKNPIQVQKVSGYDENVKPFNPKSKTLTAILVVILLILVGILALVFLFRSELVNFINGIFG